MAELHIRIDSSLDPKGFAQVQRQIDRLQKSLKELSNLSRNMMKDPKTSGWQKLEQAVKDVRKEQEKTARSMASQAKKVAAEEKKLASMMDKSEQAAREKNAELRRGSQELRRYERSAETAAGAIDDISDRYRQARKAARDYNEATDALARGNQRRIAALRQQEQAVRELEQAQRRLAALQRSGASREDLDMGRQHVRNMQQNLQAVRTGLRQYEREIANARSRITTAMRNLHRATAGMDDVIELLPANKMGDKAREQIKEIRRIEQQFTSQLKRLGSHVKTAGAQVRTQLTNVFGMGNLGTQLGSRMTSSFQAIQRSMQGVSRTASSTVAAVKPMVQVFQQITQTAMAMARTLAGAVTTALQSVNRALGSLGSSGAARFASLRKQLDATGNAFLRFGRNAQLGTSQFYDGLGRTAAGWSFLMTGQQMSQFGNMAFRRVGQSVGNYMQFEDQATRGAIAGGISPDEMMSLVFDIEKGTYGDPVRNLSSEEIAGALYAYISAMGTTVTPENRAAIARTSIPMVQLAGFTQSDPEQTTKGVINAALEFGINPRDITGTSDEMRHISSLYGFLANETTLEVTDITEFFKMTGPLANVLHRQGGIDALEEVMAFSYIASDYGLRGSKPGRGFAQVLQSLLDPTGPMNEAAMQYWGEGDIRDVFFDSWRDPLTGQTGYSLRNGIEGLVEPFMDLSQEEWIRAQSEIFTNNASRAMIPFIDAARNDPEHFQELVTKFKSGDPAEFLFGGIETASETFSASVQNMQNRWMEFVKSIISSNFGPLTGVIDTVANSLGGLAEIIDEVPMIGQALAALFTTIAGGAVVLGSLLSFAGGLFILQRALMLAGASATTFLSIFTLIPSILAMALPLLTAIALAATALKVAWDNNFLGIQDAVESLRETFSSPGNISSAFIDLINTDTFKSLYLWVIKAGQAFKQFVSGIIFGIGPIDVFNGLIQDIFGENAGIMISSAFIKGGRALREFFGVVMSGAGTLRQFLPTLGEAHSLFKGFFEIMTTGRLMENASAIRDFGDRLGIDKLDLTVRAAILPLREFAEVVGGLVVTAVQRAASAFSQMREWLSARWADGSIIAWFRQLLDVLTAFGSGVVDGFVRSMSTFVDIIDRAVRAIPALASAINTQALQPMREMGVTAESVAGILGNVFGAVLAGSLLLALSPLRLLISYVGQFAAVALSAVAAVLPLAAALAAKAAALLVIVPLVAAAQLAMWTYNTATAASTLSTMAFAAAAGGAALALGLLLAAFAGIMALAGVVVVIMTLRDGFDGLREGVGAFAAGLSVALSPLAQLAQAAYGFAQRVAAAASVAIDLADVMYALGAAAGFFVAGLSLIVGMAALVVAALGAMVVGFGLLGLGIYAATDGVTNSLDLLLNEILRFGAIAVIEMDRIGTDMGNAIKRGLNEALADLTLDPFTSVLDALGLDKEAEGLRILGGFGRDEMMFEMTDYMLGGDAAIAGVNEHFDKTAALIISRMEETGGDAAAGFWDSVVGGLMEHAPGAMDVISSALQGEPIDWSGYVNAAGFQVEMDAIRAQTGTDYLDFMWDAIPSNAERDRFLNEYQEMRDQELADWAALNDRTVVDGLVTPERFAGRGIGIEVPDYGEGRTYPTELIEEAENAAKAASEWNQEFQDAMANLATSTDVMPWVQMGVADMAPWMFDRGGNMSRNVTGFEATWWASESLMEGLSEDMPWLNPQELMLDTAGAGIGQFDVAGKYLDQVFSGAIKKWSFESGLSEAEIREMLPDYFYSEELIGPMMADFYGNLTRDNGWSAQGIKNLDVLGTAGFTRADGSWFDPNTYNEGFGFDAAEFQQFLISQAMSGEQSFDPLQYFADQWDMTIADVESYMRANGVDPTAVRDAWGYGNLENTVGMINTMGGQVVALSQDWWDYINQVTADGTDKTVEITQDAYNQLPDFVKLAMADMGYQFVIGGQQTAEQARANGELVKEAMRNAYGDAWTAVEQEVINGTAKVSGVFDEASGQWMATIEDFEGNTITMPAVEYLDFMASLDAIRYAAQNVSAEVSALLSEAARWGRQSAITQNPNDHTTSLDKLREAGSTSYRQQSGQSSGTSGGQMAVESFFGFSASDVSSWGTSVSGALTESIELGISDANIQQTLTTAIEDIELKVKIDVDTEHFDTALSGLEGVAAGLPPIKVPIDADLQEFGRAVGNLQLVLDGLPFKARVDADLQDFGRAVANLQLVLDGLPLKARVDADLSEFGRAAAGLQPVLDGLPLKARIDADLTEFGRAVAGLQAVLDGLPLTVKVSKFDYSMITSVAGEEGLTIPGKVVVQGVQVPEGTTHQIDVTAYVTNVLMPDSPDVGQIEVTAKINADRTAFDSVLEGVRGTAATFVATTWTTKLSADRSLFDSHLENARSAAANFVATTWTTKLSADRSPFNAALEGARSSGAVFAGTTFTASLSADRGPFDSVIASISGRTVATAYVNIVGRDMTGGGFSASPTGFHADGGYVRTPYQIVGEEGPELVSLPYGSYVHTAEETARILNEGSPSAVARSSIAAHNTGRSANTSSPEPSGDIHLHISGPITIGERQDLERLLEDFDHLQGKRNASARRGQVSVDYGSIEE